MDQIDKGVQMIKDCLFRRGGTVYLCGNGGSAAMADHMAAELIGRFKTKRGPYSAVSLTNPAVMTAIANDFGFDKVFARQVEALCGIKDLLIVFTTSGTSPNIVAAADMAESGGTAVLAITGPTKLPLEDKYARIHHIQTPTGSTATTQEVHLIIAHDLCRQVEL